MVEATIVVNKSQGKDDSGSGGAGVFKKMLKELKGMGKEMAHAGRLARSGLGGKAALGGAAGMGAAGTAAMALLAMMGVSKGDTPESGVPGSGYYYEQTYNKDTGERTTVSIDEKTGRILEELTEREALERGIVDSSGELLKKYTRFESTFDVITANLEKQRGAVVDTAVNWELIEAETKRGLRLQTEINNWLATKTRRNSANGLGRDYTTEEARAVADLQAQRQQSYAPSGWEIANQLGTGQSIDETVQPQVFGGTTYTSFVSNQVSVLK